MRRGPLPLTTAAFIAKARERFGDRYDYSKVEYFNANVKVTIVCPAHGDFQQTPGRHMRGDNCPKCGRISSANALKGADWPGVGRPRLTNAKSGKWEPDFGPLLAAWR